MRSCAPVTSVANEEDERFPFAAETGDVVSEAIAFIEANFCERITLRDIQAATGTNPYKLIREFRRRLGMTPYAFILDRRITRGTQLIEQGEPTARVAAELGFVDQSHFTRYFKRRHGAPPRQYLSALRAKRA